MAVFNDFWRYKEQIENKYKEVDIENMHYLESMKIFDPLLEKFYKEFGLYCSSILNDNKEADLKFLRPLLFHHYPFHQDKFIEKENVDISENLLDQIVYDTRKFLWSINNQKENNNIYTQGRCTWTSLQVLNRTKNIREIDAYIINTHKILGIASNIHSFLFATINHKNFIIDCTYSQFLSLYYSSLDTLKALPLLNAEPGYFLTIDQKRIELLDQILNKGWFEATEENVKMYIDSFLLASRNANYYLNNEEENMIDTNESGASYLAIIKNFIDYTKKKNIDVNTYFDIYFAKENGIVYGKESEFGNSFHGLREQQMVKLDQKIKENKQLIKIRQKIEF